MPPDHRVRRNAKPVLIDRVGKPVHQVFVPVTHKARDIVHDHFELALACGQFAGTLFHHLSEMLTVQAQFLFIELSLRDVGAYGDVLPGFSVGTDDGNDRGLHPVQFACLGAVTDFTAPDRTAGNGGIHSLEKPAWMHPRIDDAVVLTQQFKPRVATNLAELVVDVSDRPFHIGGRHDGVLIQSKLLHHQLLHAGLCVLQRQSGCGIALPKGAFPLLECDEQAIEGANQLPHFIVMLHRQGRQRLVTLSQCLQDFGGFLYRCQLASQNPPGKHTRESGQQRCNQHHAPVHL